MANFIILERKCKWSQTAGALLVVRSDGGAWGLPHQRLSYPSAQTGPGGRRAGRLREQREQMAGKVGRWSSERGQSRAEERGSVSYLWAQAASQDSSASRNLPDLAEAFASRWGYERGSLVRGCTAAVDSGYFRVCFKPARTSACS